MEKWKFRYVGFVMPLAAQLTPWFVAGLPFSSALAGNGSGLPSGGTVASGAATLRPSANGTLTMEETKPDTFKPREFYTGGGPKIHERIPGSVTAIDVKTGKVVAKADTTYPMLGGLLATPDLVFAGSPDGEMMALDAKTLTKLWSFNAGAGITAPPMTFTADGKQYVAILVGIGGAWDK